MRFAGKSIGADTPAAKTVERDDGLDFNNSRHSVRVRCAVAASSDLLLFLLLVRADLDLFGSRMDCEDFIKSKRRIETRDIPTGPNPHRPTVY